MKFFQREHSHRGLVVFDLILRVIAFIGCLAAAIAMGTTDETLPFFTQFIQFRARYDDIPSFTFFVIANAIASGYLVLSFPISMINIFRSRGAGSRVLLIIFDTVIMAMLTAGASAAAAIVYIAYRGDVSANWFPVCQQFDGFCRRTSGSLVGSYIAIVVFILIILISGIALAKK